MQDEPQQVDKQRQIFWLFPHSCRWGPHKFGEQADGGSDESQLRGEEQSQRAVVVGGVNPKSNVNRRILLQIELLLCFLSVSVWWCVFAASAHMSG